MDVGSERTVEPRFLPVFGPSNGKGEMGGTGRRGMKKRDASVLACVRFEVFVWGEGRVKETASQIFNSTETRTRNANLIEVSI